MKKNKTVTFLRFIAIILVVLGHSIIIYDNNWGYYSSNINCPLLVFIKHNINVIQMPLFFSISGFLFYNSKKETYKDMTIKKIKRLIIPYIFIAFIWVIPIRYIVHYSNYVNHSLAYNIVNNILLGKDNGHLWYLPTLFIIFLVFNLYKIKDRKNQLTKLSDIILFVAVLIISLLGNKLPTYIGKSAIYLLYFFIGYMINKYKIHEKVQKNTLLLIIYLIIQSLVVLFIKNISLYKILSCILPIIFIFITFSFNKIKENKIIEEISNNSYRIYLFHSPLTYFSYTYWPNINPLLMVFINFIVYGKVSFYITKLISKTKLKFIIGL